MPVPFNLLQSDSSGNGRSLSRIEEVQEEDRPAGRRRRGRGSRRRKKKKAEAEKREVASEVESSIEIQLPGESSTMEVSFFERRSVVETTVYETTTTAEVVPERVVEGCVSSVELRQRNVSGGRSLREEGGGNVEESGCSREGMWRPPLMNGSQEKLEKVLSLDWSKVMVEHNGGLEESSSNKRLPFRYFMGEVYGGNALRNTISVGNDKKRQRVYNTMFHVPLRCERLIIAGFFVCLDSFLSMLTIMPTRIAIILWRCFRQFQRPDAAELSDIGCFIVLAFGVIILQLTDISLIYHIIRGQGTVKLYVVYNVLEIFDKLLQSFGEDVLQVLFNSAEGLASCLLDGLAFELLRFTFDQTIAAVVFVVHSFILLAQAITLSTCIIAHNNALMALLVSNNFAEIKSNVFKRVSKDNLHSLVYHDVIERFHITAFVLFVLAQNILEAEGSWFRSFVGNVLLVFLCEVFIDTIKHSFLAKFNEIKPDAYSEFLEDLCKQILNSQPDDDRKTLNFIPLAPACVVIRILTPIYATVLPYGPLLWRWFWIVSWSALTFLILTICKILVGLILNRLATWYVKQRLARKQHVD